MRSYTRNFSVRRPVAFSLRPAWIRCGRCATRCGAFLAGQMVAGPDHSVKDVYAASENLGIQEMMLTPLTLHQLMKAHEVAPTGYRYKRIAIGAGTARAELLSQAYDTFGDVVDLLAGTMETSVYAHAKYLPDTYDFGLIGVECCGIRASVLNERGEQCQPGEIGRLALWVPKSQRFEGYLNANPAYDTKGYVLPGFLATKNERGEITKIGRTDDRINLGGTRLFSGKVEALLLKLPGVKEAAAVRIYGADGIEVLGVALSGDENSVDVGQAKGILTRGLKGIGGVEVKLVPELPMTGGSPDREWITDNWDSL